MKKVKIISALVVLANVALAQDNAQPKKNYLPNISVGAGVLTMKGDIGTASGTSTYTYIRGGYQLNIEERIHPMLGISLNALYGKVGKAERSADTLHNKNFESPITQVGLMATFHFDNDVIIPKSYVLGPYISTGISYVMFDPHGDLKNKDGIKYNYWSDGSIRDLPQYNPSANSALYMVRDYTYETQLTDSTANYSRNTFAVPVNAGIKIKLSDNWDVNLGATYNITFTDYIDNVKEGGNDSYLYTHFTMTYNFGRKKTAEGKFVDVDFTQIDKMDSDHDGVIDDDDRCQGTPSGVKVNGKGCPEDDDGDGVYDYMDKEKNSKRGSVVDAYGVTIPDSVMLAKLRDSLATERNEVFNQNPSLKFLEDVDAQIAAKKAAGTAMTGKLPEEFKVADLNHDGIISSNEITSAIDAFFEGDPNFTAEKLHALIDYFFEQ